MEGTRRTCGVGKARRGNESWVLRDKQELGVYKRGTRMQQSTALGHSNGVSAKLQKLSGQAGGGREGPAAMLKCFSRINSFNLHSSLMKGMPLPRPLYR